MASRVTMDFKVHIPWWVGLVVGWAALRVRLGLPVDCDAVAERVARAVRIKEV